ncbi:MAG: MBL fold metallo-hydrolase [Aquificae bacterium]|nr:MBL fold metallo-hydrolase [Aquificota bacterium]
MKRWIDFGKRQRVKDYRLHKRFFLDEKSFIYREIIYALNHGLDFVANLGHSTFFIFYKGVKVLTDPFLSPHIFGIRRQKPALRPDLLPEMDYILISHAHYDHLDMRTLRRLKRGAKVIVPENVKAVFGMTKFSHIRELKLFDEYQDSNIKIHALPVKHNKGRSILFPNTETVSYYFEIGDKSFYFGGDTAYFEGFREIGRSHKIEIALLPVGGYEPTLFLKNVHMSPWEAVQAFVELKAEFIIPIHYATFHTIPKFVKIEAPLKYFKEEIEKKGMSSRAFIIEPNQIMIFENCV